MSNSIRLLLEPNKARDSTYSFIILGFLLECTCEFSLAEEDIIFLGNACVNRDGTDLYRMSSKEKRKIGATSCRV